MFDQKRLKANSFSHSSMNVHFSYIRLTNRKILKDLSGNDLDVPFLFQKLLRPISEGHMSSVFARTKSWESGRKMPCVFYPP